MSYKYLSSSVHDSNYIPASMLSLSPYTREQRNANCRYGILEAHEDNPDGLPKFQSCNVTLGPELMEDVQLGYFPGGVYIAIYQQSNFDWLIAFKATDAIISKYIRMKNEDVVKLYHEGFGEKGGEG